MLDCPWPAVDKAFIQQLVYGVLRHRRTLDWLIESHAHQKSMSPLLRDVLRLGAYQLIFLDRVPSHAAVYETVSLAHAPALRGKVGFVNAVLRRFAEQIDSVRASIEDAKLNHPGLGYSFPDWLIERWSRRWSREDLAGFLEWCNEPARNYARVNTLKVRYADLLEAWRKEGVEYDYFTGRKDSEPLVFLMKKHRPFFALKSFQEGGFYVQDPSTLVACDLLDPQPLDRILDACAAPGGKTTYLAQKIGNQGLIVAADADPRRLERVEENARRLGADCIEIHRDAQPYGLKFDRILLDVPCSNTGVIGRRVELRWRIRKEEIRQLVEIQAQILRDHAPLLAPGGTLVYSTCSLEPEENGGQIKRFLQENPDFQLVEEREILPFRDHMDGAYAARLERR